MTTPAGDLIQTTKSPEGTTTSRINHSFPDGGSLRIVAHNGQDGKALSLSLSWKTSSGKESVELRIGREGDVITLENDGKGHMKPGGSIVNGKLTEKMLAAWDKAKEGDTLVSPQEFNKIMTSATQALNAISKDAMSRALDAAKTGIANLDSLAGYCSAAGSASSVTQVACTTKPVGHTR